MKNIIIDGRSLTIDKIEQVARNNMKVELCEEAVERVKKSRTIVDEIVENNKVIYGITTGFGKFADVTISQEDCKELQRNLIISHACGTGPNFKEEVARTIMLLRINNLSKGYSGIRLGTLNTLIEMLNKEYIYNFILHIF